MHVLPRKVRVRVLGALLLAALAGLAAPRETAAAQESPPDAVWRKAEARSRSYQEALQRTHRVLQAWLKVIDPKTGLAPQNYDNGYRWTVCNSAADLYSSLVMDAVFTDRAALDGVLRQALITERSYALRIGKLPDDLDTRTLRFLHDAPSLDRSQFGAAEWCRDGLLRITEILGPDTPWAERLLELTDEIMIRAAVPTPFGPVPGDIEVCGDMLHTLPRVHAITGDRKYLTWAERIGDYYLFEKPPHKSPRLSLRAHGGEIVSGLAELFAAASRSDPAKAASYNGPLREMLDRVLEVGQLPDGMLANIIDPLHGKIISVGLRDPKKGTNTNWGYTCNAHCTYDMTTGENRYADRIKKVLRALPELYTGDERYQGEEWRGSSDYFADFLESAIVFFNRYRVEGVEEWIAHTIPRMWAFQQADGTVNRHYHDGSFGRTCVLFAWLCSEGVRAEPWREDLRLGAAVWGEDLYLLIGAEQPWSGRLVFDYPRWRDSLHLPCDYPRINELPQWHVAERSGQYLLGVDQQQPLAVSGKTLVGGYPLQLNAGQQLRIVLRRRPPQRE